MKGGKHIRHSVAFTMPRPRKQNVVEVASPVTGVRVGMAEVPEMNEKKLLTGVKYSAADLLSFRGGATTPVFLNFCEDIDPTLPRPAAATPNSEPVIISFRKNVPGQRSEPAIKFVEDLDVPQDHIVHAYNLAGDVEWPHLNTFCAKTVGIKPRTLRMMRRTQPAQARIVFHSAEEAKDFLLRVPSGIRIRGRAPKFELEKEAPRGFKKTGRNLVEMEETPQKAPQRSKEPVQQGKKAVPAAEIATAVLVDPLASVVHEAADDSCCAKSKEGTVGAVVDVAEVKQLVTGMEDVAIAKSRARSSSLVTLAAKPVQVVDAKAVDAAALELDFALAVNTVC